MKIIAWKGRCEVHERFTGEELRLYRENDPGLQIIAHPECPPDVMAEADFTGSTAHMIDWVRNNRPKRVVMVTECSMADNVQAELPDVRIRAAVQSVPAHEAHHAAEDPRQPRLHERGSRDRSRDRRQGAPRGRAHGQSEDTRGNRHAHAIAAASKRNGPVSRAGTRFAAHIPTASSRRSRSTTR